MFEQKAIGIACSTPINEICSSDTLEKPPVMV